LKALDWSTAIALVYAAGLLLLAIRFIVDRARTQRLVRKATRVTDPEWMRLAWDCAAQIGIRRNVRILRDSGNTMPMAVGIWHGTVVIPAEADTWTEERRRAVLLHEIAHVARRDCLTQTLAAIASTLYWIHPGIWWVAHRLRIEREFACDDRVLASGTNARDYAGHLLELAHGLTSNRLPAAVSMAGSGRLEKRLLALLDIARNRRIPRLGSYMTGGAILLAVIVPLAVVTIAGRTMPVTSSAAFGIQRLSRPMSFSIPSVDAPGTWEVHPADRPDTIQVEFREGNGSYGTTIALSDVIASVVGLPAGFPNVDGPLKFSFSVEAGTFNADGVMRGRVGAGTYMFTPDPQFAEALAKRGFEQPTGGEQRLLARANIGLHFLDELAADGYARPARLADLLRAASRGVSLRYIRGMANAGYRLGTLDALIDMRASGISPEFIQELSNAGLTKLSADDLRRARTSGIDGSYVQDLVALGYSRLSLDALVELRHHGVDPEYIRQLQTLGYDKLSLDRLTELRSHGVDAEYARGLASLGYAKLSFDVLIQLRSHGIDADYVRSLQDLGYTRLPIDDFVRMRAHGVSADQVSRANARAGTRLSVDDLIELAAHGWR
jgi:beta-lactamase regulating signal transducer with metallopeptidase domain